MSPLIDCVFLLLIFFLVTTMLKKYERQIPISLADPTASVAVEPEEKSTHVGIDRSGAVYRQSGVDRYGVTTFVPADLELPAFLRELRAEASAEVSVELVVEPGTPFQTVVNVLDVFELQGLNDVRARIRNRPFEKDGGGRQ